MAHGDILVTHLSHQYLLQSKNYISPCGCQRADCFVSKESNRVLIKMVGLIGLEPMTPALSRRCSNQLSYRPNCFLKLACLRFDPEARDVS